MILMRQAMERSRFIREAGGFFKVTGRYPIYNLDYFVRAASAAIYGRGKKLYCDIKDHNLYDILHLGWCGHAFECRLFGITNEYFQTHFVPFTPKCNDSKGQLLEGVLLEAVRSAAPEEIVVRFRREPHMGGVAGHVINTFAWSREQDCAKEKFKRLLGNAIRIFMPWFKF